MYLIENPQKTTLETNWRHQKYPFQQMDIGEYFLVPKLRSNKAVLPRPRLGLVKNSEKSL